MNEYLNGCKKLEEGLYRLRENVIISNDTIVSKVALKEKLTENILGHDLPVFSTYVIKLWAKDSKNKNKRNYSKVFNKVLSDSKTTIGLMDHPEDGAESYKNVVLVCKNPKMIFDQETQEEWLAVEVTFVGKPYGETCEAVLAAGGFIEFSSSALGDVDSLGYVLEDGFFLERYADVVVNSSNGQLFFADREEPREIPSEGQTLYDVKHESIEKEDNKDLTIYNETTDKGLSDKTGEKTMSDKLNEKALELNIKSLVRDAEKIDNLFERKKQLEVAKEYAMNLTESTLVAQIDKLMTEADNSITELAEKGKDVGTLNESINILTEEKKTLTEKMDALIEEKKTLQENYDAIIKLYEDKQYEASQSELLTNKKLNTIIESLKEELLSITAQLKEASEKRDYFEALSNSKVDADEFIALKESVKELTEKNASLKEKNSALLEDVRILRRNTISERRVDRPRFKTQEETEQYNEIIEEELHEKAKEKSTDKDNLVENILRNRGLI